MKAYIYKNNKQPFYYATYDVEKKAYDRDNEKVTPLLDILFSFIL